MTTTIYWNGSTWRGEEPLPVEDLLARMSTHTLDPALAPFRSVVLGDLVRFSGNFADVSHAFCVETNDPKLVAALDVAVIANMGTPEYVAAVEDWRRREVERVKREEGLALRWWL